MYEAAALRLGPKNRLHPQPQRLQPLLGPVAHLVVAERRVEGGGPGQLAELKRGHSPASAGLLPGVAHIDDSPEAGT